MKFKVFLLLALFFLSFLTLVIDFNGVVVAVGAKKTETFRPFYEGYSAGTVAVSTGVNITTADSKGVTREWNFEGWDVDKIRMQLRFCLAYNDPNIFGWTLPMDMVMYFSLDGGNTFNVSKTIYIPALYFGAGKWGSDFYYSDFYYNFAESDFSLFGPDTRLLFKFTDNVYLANCYWGPSQDPVPPYDYKDAFDTFVQYYLLFDVDYVESEIEYKGATYDFPEWEITQRKILSAAEMISDCMFPSGVTNEVVGKTFGRESWVIIYSAQLAMMELIDLCSVFPDNASDFLRDIKRFIVWMWSRENGDGSFPFILTDGDLHCWYDANSEDYYGYDKIDSFSACAISLMKRYYEATEDSGFINLYWDGILRCRDFLYDLVNQTVWLPVDGYHYNYVYEYWAKSNFCWLHDACEVYEGFKDFAWLLTNVKANASGGAYWSSFADSIAGGIRDRMWSEGLGRYVAGYYVHNQTQDSVLAYNIITPVIYRVETNTTRANMTVAEYCAWGNMSGKYLDRDWAEDYSVNNEYSTMSGMILSSFAELNVTYNFWQYWMVDKFDDTTRFLFSSSVYPYNRGDLQNDNGILDWVNDVDATYAPEYARLIETSAWFIDGMMKLENMSRLFGGDEPWWENWEWWNMLDGVEITNMEGCGNWVFAEEVYYNFEASYFCVSGWENLDRAKIRFHDGVRWIVASYNVQTGVFNLESGKGAVRLMGGDVTTEGASLKVVFQIYFNKIINDAVNVSIGMWCSHTAGFHDGWIIKAPLYFNIYNHGGFSTLNITGDAGRVVAGDVFDLWADTGGMAEAIMIYRNLQHVKMLPFVVLESSNSKYWALDYYVDYCTGEEEWIEGWRVSMNLTQISSGDNRHVRFDVSWYLAGDVKKTEQIYMCWLKEEGNHTIKFWVDLWFNNVNSSSVVGGRVNAYWYPMKDDAAWWMKLFSNDWGPNTDLKKQSEFFGKLLDSKGQIMYASEIKLVRVGCRLSSPNDGVCVKDYDAFDLTFGWGKPFVGVQTPPYDESVIPAMRQGGILGALWTAIVNLGVQLINALKKILPQWFVDICDGAYNVIVVGWNFFVPLFTLLMENIEIVFLLGFVLLSCGSMQYLGEWNFQGAVAPWIAVGQFIIAGVTLVYNAVVALAEVLIPW